MSLHNFPAGGWLPEGSHLELKWDDQGRDFATDWKGAIQAPGRGQVIAIGHDRPFPNGFGPNYPIVRIDQGPFAGHQFYQGHTTAVVVTNEWFEFGRILAHADQGHNWSGTHGGWIELGEAFNGVPGPKTGRKWFDPLLEKPLVIDLPDPIIKWNDQGLKVLGMTSNLRDCGWLPRPYWHFNKPVHGAVVAFQKFHHLAADGMVGPATANALATASLICKKTHIKENR